VDFRRLISLSSKRRDQGSTLRLVCRCYDVTLSEDTASPRFDICPAGQNVKHLALISRFLGHVSTVPIFVAGTRYVQFSLPTILPLTT